MSRRALPTISASLALSALKDSAEAVRAAEQALQQARSERNELIRDARTALIPYPVLMRATGLKREHLSNIVNSADITSPAGV